MTEVKERLRAKLTLSDEEWELASLNIRTQHSLCWGGLRADFELLNATHLASFAKEYGWRISTKYSNPNQDDFYNSMFADAGFFQSDDDKIFFQINLNRMRLMPPDAGLTYEGEKEMALKMDADYECWKMIHGWTDFTGMIEHGIRRRVVPDDIKHILVDEAQDLCPLLYEYHKVLYAEHPEATVTWYGDEDQCHPAGTMIKTPNGLQAIETLKDGDEVVSYTRRHQQFRTNKVKVGSRTYGRDEPQAMVHIPGKNLTMTANHRMYVKPIRDDKIFVTYLMYRKGFGYRVGWCQLFKKEKSLHLFTRCRLEKADACWILKSFTSKADASLYESFIATKYCIPTIMFEARSTCPLYTKEAIQDLFKKVEVANIPSGIQALKDHFLLPSEPLYPIKRHASDPDQNAKIRRTTTFTTAAANLDACIFQLLSADGTWEPIASVQKEETTEPVTVYSLEVDRDHTYVAEETVVCNCIYEFMGADPSIFVHQPALDTVFGESSYRLPLAVSTVAHTYIAQNKNRLPKNIVGQDKPGHVSHATGLEQAAYEATVGTKGHVLWLCPTNAQCGRAKDRLRAANFALRMSSEEKHCVEALKFILTKPKRLRLPDLQLLTEATLSGRKLVPFLKEWWEEPQKTSKQLKVWVAGDESFPTMTSEDTRLSERLRAILRTGDIADLFRHDDERLTLARSLLDAQEQDYWIEVTTYHKSKGREADTVVVCKDVAGKMLNSILWDAEAGRRAGFVAMTRTKNRLIMYREDFDRCRDWYGVTTPLTAHV